MAIKYDKILGRLREKDSGSASGGSVPDGFNTWEEYVNWLVNNNFPLPDQFATWQEFIDWLTTNNFVLPDGFNTFEEYIQFLIDQSFPLPDQFATWQEFIDWLTLNSFLPPVGFATWEEYLTWLINNTIPIPDQFNTWQEFIDWLTTNNFVLPDGFNTFEEYINFLINQSFPLPDQFATWQEFIDWLTTNNFVVPEGFNTIEEYIDWYISQKFPLPDRFETWQEFIDWISSNTFPDNFSSWAEFIQYLIDENNGKDTGTYLISGTITWKSGLTFTATDLVYKILGVKYTAQGRDITLDAANVALPRIDVFIADKFGNIFATSGEPSATPIKPTVNFDELEVTQANIAAGALTPDNISIDTIYDEATPEEWETTAVSDADITVNLVDTVSPNSGTKHISVSIDIPPATGNQGTRYIGEHYQGGVIFYLYPGGKSGLIAAPSDQTKGEKFETLKNGDPYTTEANGLVIGTGKANSIKLAAHLHNAALYAIKYCVNYLGGGFNDWFLPSRDELTAMYFRRDVIGGFSPVDYWSSSEIDWKQAYSVRFSDGYVTDRDKDHYFRIRAIRAFDDSVQNFIDPVTEYSPTNTKIQFLAPAQKSVINAILVFSLKSSTPWLNSSGLLIESWNNSVKTGGVMLKSFNQYGYDHNNNGYQQIAIPLYDFSVKDTDITAFTFRFVNSWAAQIIIDIDSVRLQFEPSQTITDETIYDIGFEYRDVTEAGQVYTLDLAASFPFKVKSIVIKSNADTVTGTLKNNGVAIPGIQSIIATAEKQIFSATGLNNLTNEDLLTFDIEGLTGSASAIIGKVRYTRL